MSSFGRDLSSQSDGLFVDEEDSQNNTQRRKGQRNKPLSLELLRQMARDHTGVPAISASSERVFSAGGDIIYKEEKYIRRKEYA